MYRVEVKKDNKIIGGFPDKFRTEAEAQTFANIESIQMEADGVEFVVTEVFCGICNQAISEEDMEQENYTRANVLGKITDCHQDCINNAALESMADEVD